jgi:site-specific DNA-cytosine methylase
MNRQPTSFHLFCGAGGGSLGFQRAGFRSLGAIDNDPIACLDHEILTGEKATWADIMLMSPEDLCAMTDGETPDVLMTTAPCKGFSGCLPKSKSETEKYLLLNSLAFRGVWLALLAWKRPPPLILFENVPRIQNRGREWLDQLIALLHSYGYAVAETVHDTGALGGGAQKRRRFLLVARHMEQVPTFLRVPTSQRIKGVGEVLGDLPIPLPPPSEEWQAANGGPMHRLPMLAAINWVRLALVEAGLDWKSLPESVRLPQRDQRQNGGLGVVAWDEPAHTVVAASTVKASWASVADPRMFDVRSDCERRDGSIGITAWDQPSYPVIANGSMHNGPWSVADPRLAHAPRSGAFGVVGWDRPSFVVKGHHNVNNAPASVADPRVPEIVGPPFDIDDKTPRHMIIRAADGTWHRPMTTLELAVLQGFPAQINGQWLKLTGESQAHHRLVIGNAVPVYAAEAIGRACIEALDEAHAGAFSLSHRKVWVSPQPTELAA